MWAPSVTHTQTHTHAHTHAERGSSAADTDLSLLVLSETGGHGALPPSSPLGRSGDKKREISSEQNEKNLPEEPGERGSAGSPLFPSPDRKSTRIKIKVKIVPTPLRL